MIKHIGISIVIYTILFALTSYLIPDDKINVALKIHKIDQDGTVTFKLMNFGSDVEFSSYTRMPGEPEVYFGTDWRGERWDCCIAPPSQKLKKGEGVFFKIKSIHERAIFPWRYRVAVSAKKSTPEWMLEGMEWVYGRYMDRKEYCNVVSSAIYKGEVWE